MSFWADLIAALQTLAPGVGEDALALLQSPRPPMIEAVLATLLNDLDAIARDVVMVLDDYHAIDSRDIGHRATTESVSLAGRDGADRL